jgi:hypothetical protein
MPLVSVAQESCPEAPLILDLAGDILDGRAEVNRFEARRIGAEAAYLAILYGGLDTAAALDLIDTRLTDTHPDAPVLRAALRAARGDVEAGLAEINPDPVRAFALGGMSVRRAVLLADAGVTYFTLLHAGRAVPDLGDSIGPLTLGVELLALTSDQPDDVIGQIVKAADAAGYRHAALLLAADMTELAVFEGLMAKYAGDPEMEALAGMAWLQGYGATLRHGTGPVPRADAARQAERGELDARYYAVSRAAYHGGAAQFILTLLNQTGRDVEISAVAAAYLDEVEAGRIDPVRDPEAAWLFQYRALAKAMGADVVHATMGGFDFPTGRIRHYAGSAAETMDWVIARVALLPVVAGAELPPRPALLSPTFDWDMWTEVATALARGDAGPFEGDAGPVAAELLAGAGRWDEMEVVAAGFDPFERLVFLRDIMQRLDRGCAAYMAQPGQAMLLGGDSLYRF